MHYEKVVDGHPPDLVVQVGAPITMPGCRPGHHCACHGSGTYHCCWCGAKFRQATTAEQKRYDQSTDEGEMCPKSADGKHEPEWASVHINQERGNTYIDIACKHCGRSGCVGTAETLTERIDW